MANRSYLYSFSKNDKGERGKTFDISEQNYAIPIIHKVLISANTQIVPSVIFEDGKALVGEAKEGRKRLDTFFKKLLEAEIFDEEELLDLKKMFLEHLDKYSLDYFLFEPLEVISMSEDDFDKEIEAIFEEVKDFDTFLSQSIEWLDEEDWSELGIDFSTLLYYSLVAE